MKYGIESEGFNVKCANCGNIVAKDGVLNTNYCEKCGAPLSLSAIGEFEDLKLNISKSVLINLKEYANQYHTDSLVEVLKQYTKDME